MGNAGMKRKCEVLTDHGAHLNIAMLGHKRIPSREGGVEIVVEELSTRMVRLGNHVTCFNRRGHHISGRQFDAEQRNKYRGVRIKYVPTINRKGFAAATSSCFGALCAAIGKYDVVHIHAEGPALMCWLPKLAGKRVIVTIHGLDWARTRWGWLSSKYIKAGEKSAVKHADEIIVLSRNVQNYFFSTYGRNTIYIPNGVTRPVLKEPEEIKRLWGLEKDGYILFIGRLVPEKGIHYLLEAWKDIKTSKKLVITGGNSDVDDYINKLETLAGENVIFTGFQQGRVLEELFSNCYVYCLPSDLEGMPLSLLEAMSYGSCCVVSNIVECVEVVEDKAVTFKRGNVDDLRDKLQRLLDEPKTVRNYKEFASDFITSKYNWDCVVNQTLELYRCQRIDRD